MSSTEPARRDGTPVTERQQARGYSWEPFKKGNQVSVRHGAFSERIVGRAAAEIHAVLLERYPYLADDAFLDSLDTYCRARARSILLHNWCMAKAEEAGGDPSVIPAYLWDQASKAENSARALAAECGITAASHARIARDLGVAKSVGRAAANANAPKLGDRGRADARGTEAQGVAGMKRPDDAEMWRAAFGEDPPTGMAERRETEGFWDAMPTADEMAALAQELFPFQRDAEIIPFRRRKKEA